MADQELRKRAESERNRAMVRIYGHNAILMNVAFRQLNLLEIENRLEDLKDAFAKFVQHHNTIASSVTPANRAEQERFICEVERIYTKVFQGFNRRMDSLRCEMYVRVLPLEPTLRTTTTTISNEQKPTTLSGMQSAHYLEPIPSTSAGMANGIRVMPRMVRIPPVEGLDLPAVPVSIPHRAADAIRADRRIRQRAERSRSRSPVRSERGRCRSRSPERISSAVVRARNDLRNRIEGSVHRVQRIPRRQREQNGSRPTLRCHYCQGPHPIYACDDFLKLKIDVRRSEVAELGLCLNCLQPGHNTERCRAGVCWECNEKHNSVLCFESYY